MERQITDEINRKRIDRKFCIFTGALHSLIRSSQPVNQESKREMARCMKIDWLGYLAHGGTMVQDRCNVSFEKSPRQIISLRARIRISFPIAFLYARDVLLDLSSPKQSSLDNLYLKRWRSCRQMDQSTESEFHTKLISITGNIYD